MAAAGENTRKVAEDLVSIVELGGLDEVGGPVAQWASKQLVPGSRSTG
tara:strand:- start:3264 stop:3407 length:144 start_codon:yes stop_codon:yes gene_type:complete